MTVERIGGSSADRIINCPGSVALSAAAPEQVESAEARDGTIAHKLAELCLINSMEPDDMVGRFIGEREIDPETAEAVTFYTDAIRSWFTDEKGQTDLEAFAGLEIEAAIDLSLIDPACEGTCDTYCHLPNQKLLRVGDYKHGAGVAVEVKENKQLFFYALGALIAVGGEVETIRLTVVQPNCPHEDGPVRTIDVTPSDLFEFGLELKAAIDLSRQPNAPLKAGSHCRFCKASGFCPKLFEMVKTALNYEIDDARIADFGGTLEPDEVGRRLAMVEPLKHWLNGIKRFAYGEAQRGRPPVGYKLVRVRGRRRWIDDGELAMRQVARKFKIEEETLFKRKALTPKQTEKLVGEKVIGDFLNPFVTVNTNAVSLVPSTDKREAVEPALGLEFADLMESNDG